MSLTIGVDGGRPTTRTEQGKKRRHVDFVGAALFVAVILCLVIHVVLLTVTGTTMLAMVVPMLALSGVCVAFTCRPGNGDRFRDHAITAGFGVAMLAVHSALMTSAMGHSDAGATGHAGMDDHAAMGHSTMDMAGAGNQMSSGPAEVLMQAGLVFAAVQVVLAVGAAVRALRLHR